MIELIPIWAVFMTILTINQYPPTQELFMVLCGMFATGIYAWGTHKEFEEGEEE